MGRAVLWLRPTVAHKRSIGCFPSGAAHLRSRASVTIPGGAALRAALAHGAGRELRAQKKRARPAAEAPPSPTLAPCAPGDLGALYRPGQNACLHSIRHAAATRMLSAGADLEVVRDVLGHADVATTSLYLHSSDSRKRDAATKLALD